MTLTYDPEKAQADRDALAAEWEARAPSNPDEVAAFYRDAEHLAEDLENFHSRQFRQRFQDCLVHVASTSGAACVIDIGSGSGHDLRRLASLTEEQWPRPEDSELPRLIGVEPNDRLRNQTAAELGIPMFSDVDLAPIEHADVLNCIDVLEHIPDPEAWLGKIATRAKEGCTLIETCSTFDLDTPLHLIENRGWHPGRVLEASGWEKLAEENNMRVWIRAQTEPIVRSTLVICSGREISGNTFDAVMAFVGEPNQRAWPWRVSRASENGLLRARSIWASKWWRETNGDVFLFVDSDIQFSPSDVEMVADIAREKRAICVGAYSVRDGGHLALRGRDDGPMQLAFGPTAEPVEIEYGATGFMAIHRDVLDAMIPGLPLCHANQPWALWPLFDFNVVPDKAAGGFNWLSEDWEFCRRARELGFSTWLDRRVILLHYGTIPWTVLNMTRVRQAVLGGPESELEAHAIEEGESPNGRADSANASTNRATRRAAKRRNGKH